MFFSADGVLRFLPLLGLILMGWLFIVYTHFLGVAPLPEAITSLAQAQSVMVAQTPRLFFPFAMSSLVLVVLMLIMIGAGLVSMHQCSCRMWLILIALIIAIIYLSSINLSFGSFPSIGGEINRLLDFSNRLLVVMLMVLALSLSLLPEKSLGKNVSQLKQRVRLFKVQIYLASLLMAVGLLEIFLLYYWQFGKNAAQMVVFGNGILYSGLMIVLFLPTAWLLHRSALQHIHSTSQAHRRYKYLRLSASEPSDYVDKKPVRDEMTMLSPIAGLGHYVAVFLPVLLGLLPALIK